MKFNFKKIVSVFTSTVMLTSTLALAAAANAPAPFVTGGVANAAVVVGSSASADDMGAAAVVKAYLDSQVTVSGASATVAGGDFVQLDRSSTRLNIGDNTDDTFGRSISVSDMPTLLADGVFTTAGDNKDQDYTQKINVAKLNLTQFDDSDYASDTPTLGVRIADGAEILNYTLQFTDKPAFAQIDNSDIVIMGKTYTVVSHSGNNSITLLDAASSQIINEGETKSVTIGGKSYDVTVTDVSSANPSKVKVTVNGKTSTALGVGSTYKITDGAYIGVKDVSYKSKDAATSNAELTFGSGKLELVDGSDVQLNDNSVNNLVGYVTNSTGDLSKIILQWKADGDQFITATSSITMPGFNNIKLSSTGVTFPSNEEVTVINDGKHTVQLRAPIKDGDATINLISNNETSGSNYTIIGAATDKLLVTSSTSSLTFDADVDEEFVASWNSTRDAESYVLYATSFVDDNGVNKTTIKSKVGNFERKVAAGDTVNLGNVQLTVGVVNRVDKTVALTAGSGVSFNTLYTKDGLKVALPLSSVVNSTVANSSLSNVTGVPTYSLVFTESNKDGNIGSGSAITLTLSKTSDGYVTVSNVAGAGGEGLKEIGSSSKYVGYTYSDLGTKIVHDQNPDQNTATLTYHGSESYGNVIVSDVSTVVGGNSGILIVKDNEASAMTGKNLVVVGGSCINTVAAKLLGSNTPLCGTAWEAKTNAGAGSFVISSYANEGKIATLVAGYNKVDTENAAQYLKSNTVDTTAGKSYKGTSATTASLVVA